MWTALALVTVVALLVWGAHRAGRNSEERDALESNVKAREKAAAGDRAASERDGVPDRYFRD